MQELREAIAAVLEAELTTPVSIYAYPVEVPVLPAVVIVPDGGDYVIPLSFGRDGRAATVRVGLRIQILEPRAEPSTALNALEARRVEVTDALAQIAGAQWSGFVDVGEATVADVPSLGGTVMLSVKIGEQV